MTRRLPHERSPYEGRYNIFWHNEETPYTCFYCGSRNGVTLDHQPPISRVSDYEALNLKHEMYLKVPCCRLCNGLLGSKLSESLYERKQQLNNLIRKHYKKCLKTPVWEDDELDELGHNLKQYTLAALVKVSIATEICDYYDGINAFTEYLTARQDGTTWD